MDTVHERNSLANSHIIYQASKAAKLGKSKVDLLSVCALLCFSLNRTAIIPPMAGINRDKR